MANEKILLISAGISTGALVVVYWLIRRMVLDLQENFKRILNDKTDKLWTAVDFIRNHYLLEDKHSLICGKTALELEKMFEQKFKSHEDSIFERLREIVLEIKANKGDMV